MIKANTIVGYGQFGGSCLNIDLFYKFGNCQTQRAWFIAPIDVI